jgi:molybdopterin-containing oxidoreductase family iron-sulfur binding subunit
MIFQKLHFIVSVGADFLVIGKVEWYDSGYTQGRVPKRKMSRHFIRANMTLSAADKRLPMSTANQNKH